MHDPQQQPFWTLAAPLLERPGCERSTMMGFPCLRREGAFFASVHREDGSLIAKLPRERVLELVLAELGQPFAPNGRVFKEWVQVPATHLETWRDRLEEAWAFASPG